MAAAGGEVGGWVGADRGFFRGVGVGGSVGFAGFLAFLFRGSAKKLGHI